MLRFDMRFAQQNYIFAILRGPHFLLDIVVPEKKKAASFLSSSSVGSGALSPSSAGSGALSSSSAGSGALSNRLRFAL